MPPAAAICPFASRPFRCTICGPDDVLPAGRGPPQILRMSDVLPDLAVEFLDACVVGKRSQPPGQSVVRSGETEAL